MKGVPVRLRGPKDLETTGAFWSAGTMGEKIPASLDELEVNRWPGPFQAVHNRMFAKAKKNLDEHIYPLTAWRRQKELQEKNGGFIKTMVRRRGLRVEDEGRGRHVLPLHPLPTGAPGGCGCPHLRETGEKDDLLGRGVLIDRGREPPCICSNDKTAAARILPSLLLWQFFCWNTPHFILLYRRRVLWLQPTKGRGHGTALRCGDSGSTREIWRLGIERVTAINLCREDLTNFKVCRIMFEGFYFANFDLL